MLPAEPPRPRGFACLALALVALLAGVPPRATAASKVKIAAAGDPAPGGGTFAGPGFSGWPTAAGNGWIAFRGVIAGGNASEAIIARHETPPVATVTVASKGQSAPGGGTFRQFFGRPAVNASGDVAFLALVNDATVPDDPSLPTPAGVFVYSAATGKLTAVARSRQPTVLGVLDIATTLDPNADPSAVDLPDRTAALNDHGQVAFLTALAGTTSGTPDGAIFMSGPAGGLIPILHFGDPFDTGHFVRFGPPALNNAGMLAFHGLVASSNDPGDAGRDGIFARRDSGIALLVDEGITIPQLRQRLTSFADAVAVNDAGDVAFIGSPLFARTAQSSAEGSSGVLVYRDDTKSVQPVGYPGLALPRCGSGSPAGTVADTVLSPAAGGLLAPPALASDRSVTFFASLDGHASEAIARWDGTAACEVVELGGADADPAPTGGFYAVTASAPAVDAVGGLAFLARIAGGSSIEAIVYHPTSGSDGAVVVGEATPDGGFFAGPPFSAPAISDAGDVAFRASVAGGPSSAGIFRAHGGTVEPVVRAGDPSPPLGRPFFDFTGRPSLNGAGALAFTAVVAGQGPGLYVFDGAGRRAIARGDTTPEGVKFLAFGLNPAVNEAGLVAFRAIVELPAGDTQDGIFVAGPSDIRLLAAAGRPSPAGPNFLKMRDPVVTDVPTVLFTAPLGTGSSSIGDGLFFLQPPGGGGEIQDGWIALEGRTLLADGTTLTAITGTPAADEAGNVAFGARRSAPAANGHPRDLGPAIVRRTTAGLGLVVARDMPGPMGGTFKGFGQPAMGATGHVFFFGAFPRQTTPSGMFLATDAGLEPVVLVGHRTPIGGTFQAFGARPAANIHDQLAFTATVGGGRARQGIFVASPTRLTTHLLLRLSGGRAHDRVQLRGVLHLGTTDGTALAQDGVTLALSDASGRLLWSSTVPPTALVRHGKRFAPSMTGRRALGGQLRALQLRLGKNTIRVAAQSAALDLTARGSQPLVPPLAVTVDVGDDGGTAIVPCRLGKRGGRCGG